MITKYNFNYSDIKDHISDCTSTEKVELVVKFAELVVHLDKTGNAQKCIEASKAWLDNPCKDTVDACAAAASDACGYSYSDDVSRAAAGSAGSAASFVASTALYYVDTTYFVASADIAVYAAVLAADIDDTHAGGEEVKDKIIEMLNEVKS